MGAYSGVPVRGIHRESVGWSLGFSVLLIVVGLIALAAPFFAGVAVTAIVGWLLLLGGLGHLVLAWHVRGAGAHVWEALIAIAYFVMGGYLLLHPVAGLVGITIFLAVYLFIKGIFELFMGFGVRGIAGGGWLLVDAIVSIVLAVLIWRHLPLDAGWAVGTLLGFAILFSGISRLIFAMTARRGYMTSGPAY